jgi:hypothetical protein
VYHGAGVLSHAELESVVQKLAFNAKDALFAQSDADRDGMVDLQELKSLLWSRHFKELHEKGLHFFDDADTDKDGTLNKREFLEHSSGNTEENWAGKTCLRCSCCCNNRPLQLSPPAMIPVDQKDTENLAKTTFKDYLSHIFHTPAEATMAAASKSGAVTNEEFRLMDLHIKLEL